MRILVTGATGFVGAALIDRLIQAGRFAIVAAVRADSKALPLGVKCVAVGDLSATTDWQPALIGVDAVVHLAARAHVMRDVAPDPLAEFRRTNVDSTLNLARHVVTAQVRRFIFISSIKVNGEETPLGRPYTADDVPVPIDPYGISKLEAEQGLRQVGVSTGIEVVIVRPPLVYGPNVKGNLLRLLSWIERGVPLPFANVDNRRSILNVRNLADFIVRCIEHPAAAGETFLVSDGEDLSTRDLIRHLAVGMSKKPRLFSMPLTLSRCVLKPIGRDDIWRRLFGSLQLSCHKARVLLDWSAPVATGEGLEEVGSWYKKSKNSRR